MEAQAQVAETARRAARVLANASTPAKDAALRAAAAELRRQQGRVLAANREDTQAAERARLSAAMRDRLTLTPERIEAMARGIEIVAELPDPVGQTVSMWRRPNGLEIRQVRVPLGVVAVIYEARPNVTADAAALCLKAGNAVILKGGSEARGTSEAIVDALRAAVREKGLPGEAIQFVGEREAIAALLRQEGAVDVVIPRGGEELIRAVTRESRAPVIQHFAGVCHTYVDADADLGMAERICLNAKTQRPWVCNAMENLLVHEGVAPRFLPAVARALTAAGVEIRGCERTRALVPGARAASESDWTTEYLDLVLAVKVVGSLDEGIAFVNRCGSGLADAIVTENYSHARRFLQEVDSATVYVNASTRFTDGYEFGFGAEVGISTNRLHARGPMGLRELTTYKYVIYGSGQIRE